MIKTIHITTVFLSILLFVSRGFWIYILNKQQLARWMKIVPHVNDTVLLVTGITLTIQVQQYPLVDSWLTVKLICLLIYIFLGMVAMKWRASTKTGLFSWIAAILVFIYMITVALKKNPLPIVFT